MRGTAIAGIAAVWLAVACDSSSGESGLANRPDLTEDSGAAGDSGQAESADEPEAPTCFDVEDVGVSVPDLGIESRVESACFAPPRLVTRRGLTYYEAELTVSGVGWSGDWAAVGTTPEDGNFRYEDLTVYVFAPEGELDTLVAFTTLDDPREGHVMVGERAIQEGYAYFGVGQPEGQLLTRPIVIDRETIGGSYLYDITRLVEWFLMREWASAPRVRLAVGYAGGVWSLAKLISGYDPSTPRPAQNVGNHAEPLDPSSGRLFHGAVFLTPPWGADFSQPFEPVPLIVITGETIHWLMWAHQWMSSLRPEIEGRGWDLSDWAALWVLRNISYAMADANLLDGVQEPYEEQHGDRMGPFIAGALRNLRAVAEGEAELLPSHFGGRLAEGGLVWEQEGGESTVFPFVKDPRWDQYFCPDYPPGTPSQADIGFFEDLTAVIPATAPLEGPTVAYPAGGLDITFFTTSLARPFDLCGRYGSFESWRELVFEHVELLEAQGVYVRPIEDESLVYPARFQQEFAAQGCP